MDAGIYETFVDCEAAMKAEAGNAAVVISKIPPEGYAYRIFSHQCIQGTTEIDVAYTDILLPLNPNRVSTGSEVRLPSSQISAIPEVSGIALSGFAQRYPFDTTTNTLLRSSVP